MPRFRFVSLVFAALIGVALVGASAQTRDKKPSKPPRAAPPKWDKQVTDVLFFKDVFKEALAGPRPADLGKPPVAAASPMPASGNSGDSEPAIRNAGWSKIIDASSLEDQVKAMKQSLDRDITTPSEFAGRGYSIARREFSALAVLFGVIAEYDGDVRWKSSASAARDRFASLAATAKVGSQQAYNAAKEGRNQLEDLLGGGSFPRGESESSGDWTRVADRGPIMQNLEQAFDHKVAKWTGSESELKSNADAALAEAQMIAVYAVLLGKEGMEDSDSDSYKEYLDQLRLGALEVADAVKKNEPDRARKAAGQIKKSCDSCHGEYR